MKRHPLLHSLWCLGALYALAAGYAAYHNPVEGFDGYSFLGQAWRAVDPAYNHHFYESVRARTFVLALGLYDRLAATLLGRPPGLGEYHLFSCFLVLLTFVAWYRTFSLVWERRVVALTTLLLMGHYLYFSHTSSLLGDVFSSLLWAAFFHQFFQGWHPQTMRGRSWILLGALSGLIATTKYGHFLFPAVFAGSLWFATWWTKQKFPWQGVGTLGLFHLLTIEVLYRTTGGWNIGFFEPVRLHLQLSREYLPSESMSAFLASRRWLYIDDLLFAYGPALFILAVAALGAFLFCRVKDRAWRRWGRPQGSVPVIVFFLTWAALSGMHQWIAVKETRYFLPFLPAGLLLISSLLVKGYDRLPAYKRVVALAALGACLITPAIRLGQAYGAIRELAIDPNHREIPALFAFLRKDLPHHKTCRILYTCDRQVSGLRLDRNVYGVHLPGTHIERSFCTPVSTSVVAARRQLAGRPLDEFNEEVCFAYGDSRLELMPKPPLWVMRPLAIQVSEEEALHWQSEPVPARERIRCEKTETSRFDCYLTRRFFAFG